jgi:hypothetical protein
VSVQNEGLEFPLLEFPLLEFPLLEFPLLEFPLELPVDTPASLHLRSCFSKPAAIIDFCKRRLRRTYQRPAPNDSTVVSSRSPIFGVHGITAESRIGDDHTHVRHQTHGEASIEMVCSLIQECCELGLIRCIQKEVAET